VKNIKAENIKASSR